MAHSYYKVSVITPCFNGEKYIADCVNSVITQTYQNWELLLVDDCSTDKTLEIIQAFSKKDKRIKVFSSEVPSGGPSHPRNIGLSKATGDFIAFLDADDLWLPNKLEEQINFVEKNNLSFIYSDYEKASSNGERKNRRLKMKSQVSYADILHCCEIPCLTVLIKRELIQKKVFREIGKEDYVLWLQILKSGHVAYNTQKVHALYRVNPSSRSSNKFQMIYQQWIVLRDFEKIPIFKAVYYLSSYVIKGLIKYLK